MMNDELRMTNGIPVGKSAGPFRTVPFSSFDIRNSAFDIPQDGLMSSNSSGEGDIRRALIEADLVECMVAVPHRYLLSSCKAA